MENPRIERIGWENFTGQIITTRRAQERAKARRAFKRKVTEAVVGVVLATGLTIFLIGLHTVLAMLGAK